MERTLGLMCGAGVLPARMAGEARRQGWRVIAFTFGETQEVEQHAERVIPSRLTLLAPVLSTLAEERVSSVLFSGKFWLGEVLHARAGDADAIGHAITTGAGSLGERSLGQAVVTTLGGLGIEVLDQRAFVGDWIPGPGCWTARSPDDAEWTDIHRGLAIARQCAKAGVGQTVVLRRGVVAAVEALEGTTEAVRRGGALAGDGAIVVKAVADDNDYRFDTPTIGPDTIEAAASAGIGVVAVEAHRVLLFERDTMVARADRSGLALVAVGDGHR